MLDEFKFRDASGAYWTLGVCSLRWYRFEDREWVAASGPTGRVIGPAWVSDVLVFQTGDDSEDPGTDVEGVEELPAATAAERVRAFEEFVLTGRIRDRVLILDNTGHGEAAIEGLAETAVEHILRIREHAVSD